MSYHSTAAFILNFAKLSTMTRLAIKRQRLSPVKLRSVLHGGFPYDSFNVRAMLTPHSILRIFEWIRCSGFWAPSEECYLDIGKIDNNLLFLTSVDLNLEPEIYHLETKKAPITLDMELKFVGKTSFKSQCDIYLPDFSKPLVTQNIQAVFINAEKRRPTTPPQWWQDKFVPHVKPGGTSLRVPEIVVPDVSRIVEMDYLVGPGDIDPYCHLTSSYFIKICTDSYIQWHVKTYGYTNNGDPFRNVKYMVQNFKGEASMGDVIKVQFWQSVENENQYTFLLINKGKVISETILEFYPLVFGKTSKL